MQIKKIQGINKEISKVSNFINKLLKDRLFFKQGELGLHFDYLEKLQLQKVQIKNH